MNRSDSGGQSSKVKVTVSLPTHCSQNSRIQTGIITKCHTNCADCVDLLCCRVAYVYKELVLFCIHILSFVDISLQVSLYV